MTISAYWLLIVVAIAFALAVILFRRMMAADSQDKMMPEGANCAVPMESLHDMTWQEYQESHPTFQTAGCTWLRSPRGFYFVTSYTPTQIEDIYSKSLEATVRVEIRQD